MKVIRRFNNNVVLCVDNNGREVVAFGKALGFNKIPYELTDLKRIEKSYYGIENRYLKMINDLTQESLELSSQILDWCRAQLQGRINPNLLFTMADHIDFCIERYKKETSVRMPLYLDFRNLHPKEFAIGKRAVEKINAVFHVHLSQDEILGIAMNILNAESDLESNKIYKGAEQMTEEIIEIIEAEFQMEINKDSANYARYVSHMQYLFLRIDRNEVLNDGNGAMYVSFSEQEPKICECVLKISDYIVRMKQYKLNRDELLYLMIHIKRLCIREECYQQGITSEKKQ
ncbi:MAG: PRD domain-containing protein [Lachnospiraceae bacterium]|nr:PRD domain-containing protein [Lachnospiraceae bacterium]